MNKTKEKQGGLMSGLISHLVLKGSKCHLSNYKRGIAL